MVEAVPAGVRSAEDILSQHFLAIRSAPRYPRARVPQEHAVPLSGHVYLAEKPPVRKTRDSRERVDESLRYLLPQDPNIPYDMKHVVKKASPGATR